MKDYDVIGFDLDHTLVKYKVKHMMKHLIKNYIDDLRLMDPEKYPKQVLDFDFDMGLKVAINNVVWDINKGTIVKLGENQIITRAIYGFNKLSDKQITQLYGKDRKFNLQNWPVSVRNLSSTSPSSASF